MNKAVALGVSVAQKTEPFPIKVMRVNDFYSVFVFHDCLTKFDRLHKVKIMNCIFPTKQLTERFIPLFTELLKNTQIRSLKL